MIGKAYVYYWKNFAKFRAVSSRADFWPPVIITWTVTIGLFLFIRFGLGGFNHHMVIGSIWMIWFIVNLMPMISIHIRRIRDVGVSGWALLVFVFLLELITLLGIIGLILNSLLIIAWIFFLCGDYDVAPEGWWSPDKELDQAIDTLR